MSHIDEVTAGAPTAQRSGRLGQHASFAATSLRLDWALLRCDHLDARVRRQFLLQKYAAIPHVMAGRAVELRLPGLRFHVTNASDLGTLHSNLVDVHDMLFAG